MVGLAGLAAVNVNLILSYVEEQNEILIYTYEEDTTHISDELQKSHHVSKWVFICKEAAWVEFKNDNSHAQRIYDRMDFNPLPNAFAVTINDLTKISTARDDFMQIDGVEKVEAVHEFAEFLIGMRTAMSIIGSTIILALIVICLVIIYNSSRASVFSRRQEINIMKYVGATNIFVKFPFFIEGLFVGVLAGVASWTLTMFSYNSIVSMFSDDLIIWQALGLGNLISFSEISWIVLAANCVAGALLSAAGIIMSMGKHLKV
jgi:cell division transport system permease protein